MPRSVYGPRLPRKIGPSAQAGRIAPRASRAAAFKGTMRALWPWFFDVGVGYGHCGRDLILIPWNRRLQGPAQPGDDAGDEASASVAAPARARRTHQWYPHEVPLDQLHRVQGREQLGSAVETLQASHRPDA